jgi:hypothetical protein
MFDWNFDFLCRPKRHGTLAFTALMATLKAKAISTKAFHRIATVPLFNVVAAIAALFGVRK